MALPERITAQRTFTYDTEEARKAYFDINGVEPTDDDLLYLIESWAQEDLRSPLSRHDWSLLNPFTGSEL